MSRELKKGKKKNHYNNMRDMNLVKMVLNLESNDRDDYKKPADVYDTYINMQELQYNDAFRESLKNSKEYMNARMPDTVTPELLRGLRTNDGNSFLAVPLLGVGHLWSTVIRKTDEGYSAIVVNKGLRYWHDPMEEFVFKSENMQKLSNCLQFAGRYSNPNIEDVYREFSNKSDKAFNLKVNAGPQKVGNCFTKNVQAAIKVAQATRNFKPEDLKELRMDGYTPYGTLNEGKITFKWEKMPTEEAQILFVRKIAERNPAIKDKIEDMINLYSCNKHFMEAIKTSTNPVETLFNTFDPQNDTKDLNTTERIKSLVEKVTPYTFEKYADKISQIVKGSKNKELISLFNDMDKYSKLANSLSKNSYFDVYMEGQHDPLKSLIRVFDRNNQLKDLEPNEKAKILLSKLTPDCIRTNEAPVREILISIYGKAEMKAEYKNLINDATKEMEALSKELNNVSVRLKQISKYFPLICADIEESLNVISTKERKRIEINLTPKNKGIEMIKK